MGSRIVLIGLLILGLLLSPTVCLADSSFKVGSPHYVLDGQNRSMDVAPFIKNQRTYIPVRSMAEALGAKVEWDARTRTVNLRKGDRQVQFWMGSNMMSVNGVHSRMDVRPEMVHNRVVLPFRWVAQAFDTDVSWDNEKKTVCFGNKRPQVRYYPPAHPSGSVRYTTEWPDHTSVLNGLNRALDDYFEDVGYDYFNDNGIVAYINLSGDEDDLAYTIRLDFSGADDYDNLTDVSRTRIRTFLNAVRSRIESEIDGTDYDGADITGTLYDSERSSYYVRDNDGSYSFSWYGDDTSLSEIRNRLNDRFEDAGNDYFNDDGIVAYINLSGDEDDLAYTIRLDFSGADDYDNLTDVSRTRIRTFLNAVRSRIDSEIDGTDYDGADITGRLYDGYHSSYYVRYSGGSYNFSW
ncbi:MAG: copper amine oxidase N-terminal domain-containing protein [Firmicutes bacterium]|nr:copper amine oxidase N-terminal domain-containing protein [Bacillota bacterium]